MNYSNDHIQDEIEGERDLMAHVAKMRDEAQERMEFFLGKIEAEKKLIKQCDAMIAVCNNNILNFKEQILCNAKKKDVSSMD